MRDPSESVRPTFLLEQGKYFGRTARRRVLPGIALTETVYAPNETIPRHRHERPFFCFVAEGGFEERAHGSRRECRPSEVVYHPPGETHSDRFGSAGGRCFNVELEPDKLRPDTGWVIPEKAGLV